MEYWVFQHSITPIPHHSGSSIFHGIKMSEPDSLPCGTLPFAGRLEVMLCGLTMILPHIGEEVSVLASPVAAL
jgi:hypothetical protein